VQQRERRICNLGVGVCIYIYGWVLGVVNSETIYQSLLIFTLFESDNEEYESDDVCGVCGVAGCVRRTPSEMPSEGEGSTPPIQGCHC